jgi:preprotein translocase subunit SecF
VSFGLVELQDVSVFGRETQNEYQLTFSSMANALAASLTKELGLADGQTLKVLRVEFVGAKVGSDLRTSALLSFLVTMLIIFVYIFIRFDFVYAPGVVLALLHDVIITAGFFAMTGMEFDLTIVAALLTLAGYSVNDTIVVYDRIREVAASMKGKRFSDIIDLALNQTLARTIITGSTTLLATGALFLYGGPVIHGFAAAFLIGIVVGTYSSVFVASPVILATQKLLGVSQESKVGRAAA